MKSIFRYAFVLGLGLAPISALAEQSARALFNQARGVVASAPVIRRVDTTEQSTVIIIDQKRVEQEPQTNVVTIAIDMSTLLARQTGTFQGKEFILLKQGEKAVVKLGAGPWQIPTGSFETLAKELGNFFVCEIETPETKENAPVWELVGTELLDGQKAFVIETEGNTAVPIAQARMTKGIAKAFSGNLAQRPTVKVLEYSSKHWISKSDYRRLRTVQISQVQMTISLSDGKRQLIETSSKTTSQYSYEKVTIEIPEDAQKILSSGNLPSQMSLLKDDQTSR